MKDDFSDYRSIDQMIRAANAERSVYVGTKIADGLIWITEFVKRVFARRDRQARAA